MKEEAGIKLAKCNKMVPIISMEIGTIFSWFLIRLTPAVPPETGKHLL
jgi:uncharacterized membrane protein (UPF0136 family)